MKPRIAIFVKNLTSGGAERQATYLASLLARDYDVRFLIFNEARTHAKYLRYLEDKNVKVVGFGGGFFDRLRAFRKYLKTEKIDVIFSYLTAANLIAAACTSFSSTKCFAGIRNARLPLHKHLSDAFVHNFLATGSVVNCHSGYDYFSKRGFNKNKFTVIPNCFFPGSVKAKNLGDEIRVITVARFVKQKDYPTALRAFATAQKAYPKLRYRIVGYGEEEQEIRALISELGLDDYVEILLNPDNIPELLAESDIYLSTSLFEGTSNSILEAMDASLAIVATNVGDNSRLVRDGVNGYTVGVKDMEGIVDSLVALADDADLRREQGEASRQILVEEYGPEAFLARYKEIISR